MWGEEPEVKRPLGRPRLRLEDNIKIDLQEVDGGHRLDRSGSEQGQVVDYQSLLFTNECTSVCLKNIKIYVKIALTCFGAVTPSSGSSLSVLAKVTLC